MTTLEIVEPTLGTLERLCGLLGVSVDEALSGRVDLKTALRRLPASRWPAVLELVLVSTEPIADLPPRQAQEIVAAGAASFFGASVIWFEPAPTE